MHLVDEICVDLDIVKPHTSLELEKLRDPRRHLIAISFHRENSNRSAVIADSFDISDRETVVIKKRGDGFDRVIPQVLVVDRVVLDSFQQIQDIVRFGDEDASVTKQAYHTSYDATEIW